MNTENEATVIKPLDIANLAKDKDFDVDKIGKIMEFQEQWEAREAKKAYIKAMTAFKSTPPNIEKDAKVSYSTGKGQTEYTHATLGNVTETINKALSSHGLSAGWSTTQAEGVVTVKCTLTHAAGHSESTSLQAGLDTSGGKNNIQALGSSVSYLQRYTLLSITGLSTKDIDDDGRGAGMDFITGEQVETINGLINDSGADVAKFLEFIGCEDVETMPQSSYIEAVNSLRAKVNKNGNR